MKAQLKSKLRLLNALAFANVGNMTEFRALLDADEATDTTTDNAPKHYTAATESGSLAGKVNRMRHAI